MSIRIQAHLVAAALFIPAAYAPAQDTTDVKKPADPSIAAYVGDHPISLREVDAKVVKMNMQMAQAYFDARRNALDELIAERTLAKEAEEAKTTASAMLKERIAARVKPPTKEEVGDFYTSNIGRMGGQSLEQISPQIIQYLTTQREAQARVEVLKELKEKNSVRITLDAPRVEMTVAAGEPSLGPATAPVTIVEYLDFECPYCASAGETMKKVRETYGDKVRVVYRDFPLAFHQRALPAAEAARCAGDQGKFWEYHDKLFANQQSLADADLKKYAADLSLNVEAFNSCLDSGKHREAVRKDQTQGEQSYGVSGTPAFFVNGRFVSGAQPFEAFKPIIDDELSR